MFIVFGKENCPFCVKAVDILRDAGVEYSYHDVSKDPEAMCWMKSRVEDSTGELPKTVPQIFRGESYVGGYTDLFNSLPEVDDQLQDIYLDEL